ncbi:MAG: hypothetical protein N2171_03000 [Clostridia bacterium]|nr:hypothetical protein [Clostridia bacterium]
MNRKKQLLLIIGGAALAGAYSALKGRGIFNQIRFKSQREAIERYLENRERRASHSNVEVSAHGWSCILTESDGSKFLLYISRCDGGYVFSEHNMRNP